MRDTETNTNITVLVEKWIPESSFTSFVRYPDTDQLIKVIDIDKIKEELLKERYTTKSRISRKKQLYVLYERHKHDSVPTHSAASMSSVK